MSNFNVFVLCVSLVIITSIAVYFIRYILIKNKLFDIPNNRSSHVKPTPRGGGTVIVVTLLLSIGVLALNKMIETDFSIGMLLGISLISTTGLIDDIKSLPVLIRVIMYVSTAVLSLYLIGVISHISINNYSINLGYFAYFFSTLFLVWLTNLYNFMDGTDGFAATQTICVALFCGLLLFSSDNISLGIIFFCCASSTIGFLVFNWPPAKIFMGDSGSLFLGYAILVFIFQTNTSELISIWTWLIMLAFVLGDTTTTSLLRLFLVKRWYGSHRSNAYQNLARVLDNHLKVLLGIMIYHILWLMPLAIISITYPTYEMILFFPAYIPVIIFTLIYGPIFSRK